MVLKVVTVPLGFRKACFSDETQQSPSSPHSGAQEQSTKGGDIKNMEINKYRVHKRVFNFRKPAAPHTIGGRDVFCTSDLRWHGSKDEGLIGGPGQGPSSKFSYQLYTFGFLCHLAENMRVRSQDKK